MEILLQRAAREKGLDSLMTEVRRGHVDAIHSARLERSARHWQHSTWMRVT